MLVGAGMLLIAVVFVASAFRGTGPDTTEGYQITAVFNDASGLGPGTEVRIAGIKIGSVIDKRFDAEAFEAVVTLVIDQEIKLPTDSEAHVAPDGLLGGNFLLVKPGEGRTDIAPGGRFEKTFGAVSVVDKIGERIFSGTGGGADAQGD
jgi:phospholipid/cholesterol/gamma-HCH transport system substrate-binding protein